MSKTDVYFKLRLSLDHPPFLFSTSFGFIVCFSSDSLVFGDICSRKKLHKRTTCIWIALVMRGRFATHTRSLDLYLGPCYRTFMRLA